MRQATAKSLRRIAYKTVNVAPEKRRRYYRFLKQAYSKTPSKDRAAILST